jgi:hypothetical protein
LIDRLRDAKSSTSEGATGHFGGAIDTGPTSDSEAAQQPLSLMPHTTRKPADVSPALEAADRSEPSAAVAWQTQLTTAIAALESELASNRAAGEERTRLEASARLLHLVAGQRDEALRAIEGLEPAEQEFWRNQLHSLSLALDADGTPVHGRRAALALRPLREAVDHLASQATLDVRNVALCSEVTIWGNYKEFAKYEFRPDQEVLLYFEVENFASEESAQGFATEFISSYEIFDTAGRRVAEQQFPVAQETCKNRRRDYFIRYHLHVPKQLTPGSYTLQLTVEDQKGHKFGQGSVKFAVVSG